MSKAMPLSDDRGDDGCNGMKSAEGISIDCGRGGWKRVFGWRGVVLLHCGENSYQAACFYLYHYWVGRWYRVS